MKADTEMTGIFPKKESARMAATTGNMLTHPLTIFEICVAAMLLMLNTSIRKTTKFITHPNEAMDRPNNVAAPYRALAL